MSAFRPCRAVPALPVAERANPGNLAAAQDKGRFTVFAMVDALTRIASRIVNAGERITLDQKAAQLLTLAA